MAGEVPERQFSGKLITQEATGRGIWHGTVTVGVSGTAVKAPISPAVKRLYVQAASNNAGNVYMGDFGVTAAGGAKPGYQLAAGEAFPEPLFIQQASHLWFDADNNDEDIVLIGVT